MSIIDLIDNLSFGERKIFETLESLENKYPKGIATESLLQITGLTRATFYRNLNLLAKRKLIKRQRVGESVLNRIARPFEIHPVFCIERKIFIKVHQKNIDVEVPETWYNSTQENITIMKSFDSDGNRLLPLSFQFKGAISSNSRYIPSNKNPIRIETPIVLPPGKSEFIRSLTFSINSFFDFSILYPTGILEIEITYDEVPKTIPTIIEKLYHKKNPEVTGNHRIFLSEINNPMIPSNYRVYLF